MPLERKEKHGLSLRSKLLLGVLAVVLASITAFGLLSSVLPPAAPEQPIAFSHRLHAGDKQMDCQYCHTAARRSTVAGLPTVERCMGCHQYIAVHQPEIRKLADYWVKKQPIPWVRVYDLPDYVYFSHKRHIVPGLRCQECHGPVETMEAVYQYSSLEMGWCLSCHEQRQAGTGGTRAPIDCATCHK